MAITVYKSGAQMVKKFDDVATDFPSTGIPIADTVTVGVNNQSAGACIVQYTMDSPDDINTGNATWIDIATLNTGKSDIMVSEYAPTGINFSVTGSGVTAWVKS